MVRRVDDDRADLAVGGKIHLAAGEFGGDFAALRIRGERGLHHAAGRKVRPRAGMRISLGAGLRRHLAAGEDKFEEAAAEAPGVGRRERRKAKDEAAGGGADRKTRFHGDRSRAWWKR